MHTKLTHIHKGVRMKSQILAEDVKVDFREKSFSSPLIKHVSNFEFAKLGRFGHRIRLGGVRLG